MQISIGVKQILVGLENYLQAFYIKELIIFWKSLDDCLRNKLVFVKVMVPQIIYCNRKFTLLLSFRDKASILCFFLL